MSKLPSDESFRKVLQAERSLANRRDIKLVNNKIFILNGKDPKNPCSNDIGIKAWGYVDCLVNYGNYRKHRVDNFKNLYLAR